MLLVSSLYYSVCCYKFRRWRGDKRRLHRAGLLKVSGPKICHSRRHPHIMALLLPFCHTLAIYSLLSFYVFFFHSCRRGGDILNRNHHQPNCNNSFSCSCAISLVAQRFAGPTNWGLFSPTFQQHRLISMLLQFHWPHCGFAECRRTISYFDHTVLVYVFV